MAGGCAEPCIVSSCIISDKWRCPPRAYAVVSAVASEKWVVRDRLLPAPETPDLLSTIISGFIIPSFNAGNRAEEALGRGV